MGVPVNNGTGLGTPRGVLYVWRSLVFVRERKFSLVHCRLLLEINILLLLKLFLFKIWCYCIFLDFERGLLRYIKYKQMNSYDILLYNEIF